MARKRRRHSREFKIEAVKLVTEKGYSIAEAARSLDICETLLRSWKLAFEKQADQAFPANRRHLDSAAVLHDRQSGGGSPTGEVNAVNRRPGSVKNLFEVQRDRTHASNQSLALGWRQTG